MANEIFSAKLNAASKKWLSVSTECHEKDWYYNAFRPDIFDRIETLYNDLMDFELDGADLDAVRDQVEAEEPFVGQTPDDTVPRNEANFIAFFNRTSKLINRFKEALDTVDFANYIADNGD
jgi:hypothetical protein